MLVTFNDFLLCLVDLLSHLAQDLLLHGLQVSRSRVGPRAAPLRHPVQLGHVDLVGVRAEPPPARLGGFGTARGFSRRRRALLEILPFSGRVVLEK